MSEEALFVNDEHEDQVMEDDPVVSEVPVYLSNRAGPSLVLLQYPTRANTATSTESYVSTNAVRLKKESQVLEVELNTHVPPHLINASASTSTSMGVSQTYHGILSRNKGRYAVGYVHNGELHLSLVPSATQLRPKFAQTEVSQNSLLQGASSGSGNDSGQPALRSVQMSVKSTSTEVPRHSSVLEFWRQSNKEEPVELAPEEPDRAAQANILALDVAGQVPDVECKDLNGSMVFL